ncbi:hypothetical protein J6590_050393 [Homalodisca vitripennis]|nr:hypothetical protein J6590_050393 [Homalodisca vitripennis]
MFTGNKSQCPLSQVRVTVDVVEGGELFVSYTSSIQPTILRRENLRYSKYFDCDCSRCSDPTELGTHLSSLKCTKCDNGLIMSSDPLNQEATWKCTHCEFAIRPDTLRKIFRMIQSEVEQVDLIEEFDDKIQESEKLLKKYKSVLHPHHVYMTSLRHSLVQLYGRAPGYTFQDLPDILLERKVDLCRLVLKVADVVKPGMNRFRGTRSKSSETRAEVSSDPKPYGVAICITFLHSKSKIFPPGMVLYELHVPLMLYNRNRYEYGELKKEEFKSRMEEVANILEEAVNILSLEDPNSPEGSIGPTGRESLVQLRTSINDL